jgi:hypothetical protein
MTPNKEIRKLKRAILFKKIASLTMIPIGAWLIYLSQQDEGALPVLVGGIITAIIGLLGFSWLGKWQLRLLNTYKNASPVDAKMNLKIEEWSDSTDYTAIVQLEKAQANWLVPVDPTKALVTQIRDKSLPVKVYCEKKSSMPMVIETEYGVLWGSGTARLADEREG